MNHPITLPPVPHAEAAPAPHYEYDGPIGAEDLTVREPAAALAYWRAKCGAAPMPKPRDIDPREIGPLLAHVAMIEVLHEAPLDFLYRIDGEAIYAALGFRRMGRRFSELRDTFGAAYQPTRELYTAVVTTGEPQFLRSRLKGLNRSFYALELALLPLSQDGARVDRLFICSGFVRRPEDL